MELCLKIYGINIILCISFCALAIASETTEPPPELRPLEDKLLELWIVPEVLQYYPKYEANVRFPSGAEAKIGNTIRVSELNGAPEVHWVYNSSKLYSILITDMDNNAKEYQLWFVCNIPCNDVSKGHQLLEYMPPNVTLGSDPHRIAVIVFEQKITAPENASVYRFINLGRTTFTAMDVTMEYKSIIFAVNCFQALPKPQPQTTEPPPDLTQLQDKLLQLSIVPEVLHHFPKYEAKVRFPSGAEAKIGNTIRVSDLNGAPEVHWVYNTSKLYSILITDMDDNASSHHIIKEHHLWFVCNIPGNDVSRGHQHFEYIPPNVISGSDPHRITVTVFEQSIAPENASVTNVINMRRHLFAAMDVTMEYKAIIFAANCFNATL